MLRLVEIIVGLEGGEAVKADVETKDDIHVAHVDPSAGVSAEDLARALRQTLSAPFRASARETVPFIRATLRDDNKEISVADDAYASLRMLTEIQGTSLPLIIEAETHPGRTDPRVDVILSRVAGAFDAQSPEDLAPLLSDTGQRSDLAALSPTENALVRAHAKARQLAREVQAIDDKMTASVVPDWIWVATGLGGVGVMMTAVVLFKPELRVFVIPAMVAVLLLGLAAYALVSWKELKTRALLSDARGRVRTEREAARAEVRQVRDRLAKKGVDPDGLLSRLSDAQIDTKIPTVLGRTVLSEDDRDSLRALGRQVLVFVSDPTCAGAQPMRPVDPSDGRDSPHTRPTE